MGEEAAFLKIKRIITTGDMTITPLGQGKLMFCLMKTVIISHGPVTSVLFTGNLNICLQIVLVTRIAMCRPYCGVFPLSISPEREL